MDRSKPKTPASKTPTKPKTAVKQPVAKPVKNATNPPRTTKGWLTSPKFGNAGTGGAEFDPGPERD